MIFSLSLIQKVQTGAKKETRALVAPSCAGTHRYDSSLRWWAIRSIMLCFLMTEEGRPRFLCPLPIYIFIYLVEFWKFNSWDALAFEWLFLTALNQSALLRARPVGASLHLHALPRSPAWALHLAPSRPESLCPLVPESRFTCRKVGILIAPSLVGLCAHRMPPCVRGSDSWEAHSQWTLISVTVCRELTALPVCGCLFV